MKPDQVRVGQVWRMLGQEFTVGSVTGDRTVFVNAMGITYRTEALLILPSWEFVREDKTFDIDAYMKALGMTSKPEYSIAYWVVPAKSVPAWCPACGQVHDLLKECP